MKKLLVTLVVLGAIAALGWYLYQRYMNPEGRACRRLAELCGEQRANREECEERLASFKKAVGEAAHDKAMRCVGEAESCLGAVGCMAGAGLGGLGQFMEGLIKGLDPDLDEKGRQLLDKIKQQVGDGDKLKQKGKALLEGLKKTADDLLEDDKQDEPKDEP